MRPLISRWDRLPFLARLLTTASLALLLAGLAMLLVSAREDGLAARADLETDLASELSIMPVALAESVVVGDYATLHQTLDRYVQRPEVLEARFSDTHGVTLESRDEVHERLAPPWFRRLQGFEDVQGATDIAVGGRLYGTLRLTMTAQIAADRSWQRLQLHLAILALAIALDFLGIWMVLKRGLRPLLSLEQGAEALAGGDLERRLKVWGSPEIRSLISAFNRMADSLQAMHQQLLRRNEEMIRFSEISAHHLQEPTRRLITFSQRLERELEKCEPDEEANISLGFIVKEATRLRNLVRDIELYLAAPQPLGRIRPLATGAVLQSVLAPLKPRLEAAQAKIDFAPLPSVLLDERRLSEIFEIILDNAIRYRHPERPLRVTVSGGVSDGRVHLRFADNGRGIAPDYRQRVFRVFERLSSLGEDDLSTGIGLSILRRVAESAGGSCWIEDGIDGGAALLLDLPHGDEA